LSVRESFRGISSPFEAIGDWIPVIRRIQVTTWILPSVQRSMLPIPIKTFDAKHEAQVKLYHASTFYIILSHSRDHVGIPNNVTIYHYLNYSLGYFVMNFLLRLFGFLRKIKLKASCMHRKSC